MSDRCTFEIFHEDDDQVTSKPCGRRVVLTFEKDGRFYPRCTIHASDRVRAIAAEQGFSEHPAA